MVLSTIHTNDTLGAITRLIDMGVEPYLLASSLRTIISQRLVRKLSSDGETFSGRQGIFEILDIDQNVKELINDDFSEKKVRDIIDPQHDFLEESGQKLIQKGVTTLEEVRRVLTGIGRLVTSYGASADADDSEKKRTVSSVYEG